MKTVLNSLFIRDSLDTIKLASLYFDQILLPESGSGLMAPVTPIDESKDPVGQVIQARVVASWSSVSDRTKRYLKPLEDEGILIVSKNRKADYEINEGVFYDIFDEAKAAFFFTNSSGQIIKHRPEYNELAHVVRSNSHLVSKVDDFNRYYDPYDLAQSYFSFLAELTLSTSINHGCSILTDSRIVNELMSRFISSKRLVDKANRAEQQTNFLTHRVLQEFLPKIGRSSIEDVLEVRYRMRTELEAFRAAMSKFSANVKSCPWGPDIQSDSDKIIETQIKPAIHDLKTALQHSKLQVVQRVFENVKNPAAYVPLLATVASNVKPAIALLASMGVVGAKVLWDTLVERQKLQDTSGLTFLLRAPKSFEKLIGSDSLDR
jgi:hypothetical protein